MRRRFVPAPRFAAVMPYAKDATYDEADGTELVVCALGATWHDAMERACEDFFDGDVFEMPDEIVAQELRPGAILRAADMALVGFAGPDGEIRL